MRKVVIGLLLLLLNACAQPVPQERLSGIRTVGVISAMGDEFSFTTVGLTVFGNDFKQAGIGSWGLDDFMVAQITEALRQRYDVRPLTYRRAAFKSENMDIPVGWQGPFDRRRTIHEVIRTDAQPQGLDAYVIVVGDGSRFGNTNQGVRGVGLAKGGLLSKRIGLHALYRVAVVSGQDQRVIGKAQAEAVPGIEPSVFLRGPSREVGPSLWSDGMDAMSPSQQEQVKAGLRDLIARSVPQTLRDVGLLN